jgi:hypothetical protein
VMDAGSPTSETLGAIALGVLRQAMGIAAAVLKRKLREAMPELFRSEVIRIEPGDRVFFRIPRASTDVGDLTVWVDDDEITVGIKLSHTHFDRGWVRDDSLTEDAIADAIVTEAAGFVRAMLAGEVAITARWRNGIPGRVTMTRLDQLDERSRRLALAPEDENERVYRWTGPVDGYGESASGNGA